MVRSIPPLGGMYLRIHFTHQTQESRLSPGTELDTAFLIKKCKLI
ncbi:hypothetical protein C789_4443 [Microcystis aeruginosa FACHB-905 = DIANCHI905]|nr:hypothetical protein C789_4443 [Microcystis aeruginosa FACHB-905 = DIANCHI905]